MDIRFLNSLKVDGRLKVIPNENGLVDNGILKNDGWKEIGDVKHIFEVSKENPRIEVILHEKINR